MSQILRVLQFDPKGFADHFQPCIQEVYVHFCHLCIFFVHLIVSTYVYTCSFMVITN